MRPIPPTNTRPLSLRVDPMTLALLRSEADRRGVTVTRLVREAVANHVSRQQTQSKKKEA